MNKLMDKMLKLKTDEETRKYISILSESELFLNRDIIQTEYPIINAAFCGDFDGGMLSGLTVIAGPPKTYKTNKALICVKAYLQKYLEAICVFYDTEGGFTEEYVRSQGIDPSRVLHIPVSTIEALKNDIVQRLNALERGEKTIFVIDSIGNAASTKEIKDALENKDSTDMSRNKVLKGVFRMIQLPLLIKDVPCVAISHTYDTMAIYSKRVISGGNGLIYNTHHAFLIDKKPLFEKVDKKEVQVGFTFTLSVYVSRHVKERAKFEFTVLYGQEGIQKYSGLWELAREAGIISGGAAGWFTKKGDEKKYYRKDLDTESNWKEILQLPEFKQYVRNKYKLVVDTNE
jgi:hypothetical protein